jgi:hypothetical protein
MATTAKNIILHGVSGKLGDQIVIRQRGGKTIISQAPGEREGEPTAAQLQQQSKFQQAVIYGKAEMADPVEKAEYQEKASGMKTAFNVAVADFFHAPDVDEIDMTAYNGAVGDTIRVRATDDFKVEQVHIAINNGDGSLVEEGDAVQQTNEIDWLYTATAENSSLEGDKIVVQVSDKPGNITEQEQLL